MATRRNRSSPPNIWSLAEPHINVLAGYVAGFASLGLFNTDPVGREGGWMVDLLKEPLRSRRCVLLEAAVPTGQAAFVPSTDLACGPQAAAIVIPILLT
jgi:hypothetical protein